MVHFAIQKSQLEPHVTTTRGIIIQLNITIKMMS